MNLGIKIMQNLFRRRITKSTDNILALGDLETIHQREVQATLEMMEGEGGLIRLGNTYWGYPLNLPFSKLISHSLVVGATGSGKSYFALLLLVHSLNQVRNGAYLPMAVIDPKGELAQKALQYIHAFGYKLNDKERNSFYKKVFVLDFSDDDNITPYNILDCSGQSTEMLVSNRLETIGEIYEGGNSLTARMKSTLKYCLMLLIDNNLPISFFDKVFFNNDLVKQLAGKSANPQLRNYFLHRFDTELKSTLFGLRMRIDSLFVSENVKLSLSGKSAPDFKRLQDEGSFVIVNLAGSNISRSTTEFLLRIILSDIKQSVFQRIQTDKPFLFFIDEAQNLYKNRTSSENMNDLLTMSRSYNTFISLLCQSLSSSVRDNDILNSILANVRWLINFRSTPRDARILSSAIPTFGKFPNSGYSTTHKITHEQELKLRLEEVSHFKERTGYLWLKSELSKAVKITTRYLPQPYELAACSYDNFKAYLASKKGKGLVPKRDVFEY